MNSVNKSNPAWGVVGQSIAILTVATILGLLTNALRSDGLILNKYDFKNPFSISASARLTTISIEEAIRLFETQRAVFVDARSEEEYAWGHIAGARNLPWDQFGKKLDSTLYDVSKATPIVIYSDGIACGRAASLALSLRAAGFTNIYMLINGWTLWQQSNMPVDVGLALP